jgi:predicted ribosomally synthesized peptide with SipW-like signal peptide
MPRIKLFLSLMIIVLAVALVGGATLAWFTDSAETPTNSFEAGTVEIEAGWQEDVGKIITENWNPGDCTDFKVCLTNKGSKTIRVRAQFEGRWVPGDQRMLVIYTGQNIQLLALDWNSFCKGCTGKDGYIAEGVLNLSQWSTSYFKGVFTSFNFIKDPDWLLLNTPYSLWCVDTLTQISYGDHDPVFVYDPYCNSDWYDEEATQTRWAAIPWHRLDYIINNYFVGVDGVTKDDIQDAIWSFTNPGSSKYQYKVSGGGQVTISDKAKEIVDDVYDNADLELGNVNFSLGDEWEEGDDGWWYYKGEIPGTFSNDGIEQKICFDFKLCLDGATTGNDYQAASYHLYTLFEAIQASNEASDDQWKMAFDGTNWTPVPEVIE